MSEQKTISQVMGEFHARVPFPWTVSGITSAGYEPSVFVAEITDALIACTDSDAEEVVNILRTVKEFKESL